MSAPPPEDLSDEVPDPAPVVKRSISVAGHQTSISLEEPFWQALKDIAAAERCSVSELLARIDRGRPEGAGLSSSARLYALRWYQRRLADGAA